MLLGLPIFRFHPFKLNGIREQALWAMLEALAAGSQVHCVTHLAGHTSWICVRM